MASRCVARFAGIPATMQATETVHSWNMHLHDASQVLQTVLMCILLSLMNMSLSWMWIAKGLDLVKHSEISLAAKLSSELVADLSSLFTSTSCCM